ncbi:ABC transporter ATP-binding protein [Clostridium polynesiense]|uniref:ABC transporter ATP-binding protein n=1 Tax=Clostridium polynesiense TaxID=1325933 RepID=UPI00058CFE3C|nr:ABC transporter ATP-binding protein [Clostridium polynesiense]
MSLVEIQNINMNYHSPQGETEALKNISLNIQEGDFISIIGPSGCGKSTLLNIMCGLLKPSSGKILLEGKEINEMDNRIGYMFQKDHLFEWLNLWENVSLGLKIQKKLNKKTKEYLENLLDSYGLSSFKKHYPNELSGGMRQRAALIRTLALSPHILLLDEPFSALDYQTRLKVCDEIFQIIKNAGKTVVMVTHDIAEAISTSSRVVVLSKRPSSIKKEILLEFSNEYETPLHRREAPEFRNYFNTIWKELDFNE